MSKINKKIISYSDLVNFLDQNFDIVEYNNYLRYQDGRTFWSDKIRDFLENNPK